MVRARTIQVRRRAAALQLQMALVLTLTLVLACPGPGSEHTIFSKLQVLVLNQPIHYFPYFPIRTLGELSKIMLYCILHFLILVATILRIFWPGPGSGRARHLASTGAKRLGPHGRTGCALTWAKRALTRASESRRARYMRSASETPPRTRSGLRITCST